MEAEAEAKRILKMEAGTEVVQKLGASTSLVPAVFVRWRDWSNHDPQPNSDNFRVAQGDIHSFQC